MDIPIMHTSPISITLEPQQHAILGLTDSQLVTFAPVISYWLASAFYETIDWLDLFSRYRVYASAQERSRNLVSRSHVLRIVLITQIIQIGFALLVEALSSADAPPQLGDYASVDIIEARLWQSRSAVLICGDARSVRLLARMTRFAYLAMRQFAVFFVFDTWAYWVHWAEHTNKYLYRNIHSVHHQNYVPYSFASAYNHPIEGFFNDVLGPFFSVKLLGLSDREAAIFYTLATVKAVDDHSGLALPWNPIRLFGWATGNGLVHHNIHHQTWGLKSNFALYFRFWDWVNGTTYHGTRRLDETKGSFSSQSTARLKNDHPRPRRFELSRVEEEPESRATGIDDSKIDALAEARRHLTAKEGQES